MPEKFTYKRSPNSEDFQGPHPLMAGATVPQTCEPSGCPECGAPMFWATITVKDGSLRWFAQCQDKRDFRGDGLHHGFFYQSKHCERKAGRRPGPQKPRPESKPENPQTNPQTETKEETEPMLPALPKMTPAETPDTAAAAAQILSILTALGGSSKDVEALKARVTALENREGRVEAIKVGELPPIKIEGTTHKVLPKLIALWRAGVRNFLLSGPAGTGKSTLVEHFYEAIKQFLPEGHGFYAFSATAQTPPERIEGFVPFEGAYVPTPAIKSWESPGVTLWDEAFCTNSNTLSMINPIAANNRIMAPDGMRKRHPENVFFLADNTTGQGPDRQYTARSKPDASTLDRFFTVFVDYDENVERAYTGCGDKLYRKVSDVRALMTAARSTRVVGMRWLKKLMYVAAVENLTDPGEIINVIAGEQYECWSADDRRAAGLN